MWCIWPPEWPQTNHWSQPWEVHQASHALAWSHHHWSSPSMTVTGSASSVSLPWLSATDHCSRKHLASTAHLHCCKPTGLLHHRSGSAAPTALQEEQGKLFCENWLQLKWPFRPLPSINKIGFSLLKSVPSSFQRGKIWHPLYGCNSQRQRCQVFKGWWNFPQNSDVYWQLDKFVHQACHFHILFLSLAICSMLVYDDKVQWRSSFCQQCRRENISICTFLSLVRQATVPQMYPLCKNSKSVIVLSRQKCKADTT